MKKSWWTIIIILGVILLSIIVMNRSHPETDEEVTKCIGEKSTLYVQLGCSACKTQEEMFGENYKYLTVIDCVFERDKCSEISSTPTWIIDGEKYKGIQSFKELKKATGC